MAGENLTTRRKPLSCCHLAHLIISHVLVRIKAGLAVRYRQLTRHSTACKTEI